jgi:hypothetical protein
MSPDAALTVVALLVAAAPAEEPGVSASGGGNHSAFVPLPMYSTVPNEGSTYGLMPVWMGVSSTEDVRWILAPSASWNKAAGVNVTFRYYRFPRAGRSWSVIAAASTRVNRTLWGEYTDLPTERWRPTVELIGQIRRNIFYRYFGLGPDSLEAGESSYTRLTENLSGRLGVNLPAHLNGGLRLTVRKDRPLQHAIFGLPPLEDAHPDAPGLSGAALASAAASLRYDTREGGDYAENGVGIELAGTYASGLRGFDQFWRLTGEVKALRMETSFLQGAGRVYWTDQTGGQGRAIPFYYQSSLGGELLLRGFPEDRFIDRGAWTAELEQRFRILQTHIFHVTTDWRIDPFVAVGQVYPRWKEMFSRPRLVGGIGLRAWVRPNVLGRVDVAYGSEGLRAYVVLGYPY